MKGEFKLKVVGSRIAEQPEDRRPASRRPDSRTAGRCEATWPGVACDAAGLPDDRMPDRRSGLHEIRSADVVVASCRVAGDEGNAAGRRVYTGDKGGACCARHRGGARPRLRGGAARPAVTPYLSVSRM
jgi:hypothetical protein